MTTCYAQPPCPGCGNPGDGGPPPGRGGPPGQQIPIDGGIELLIIAGIMLAYMTLKRQFKPQT